MRNRISSLVTITTLVVCSLYHVGFEQKSSVAASTASQAQFNIGIITDGLNNFSPNMMSLFKNEIQRIAEGEFIINFPEDMIIEANSTLTGIQNAIETLVANPRTDLILTLGLIGSTEALQLTNLNKPVVAPFVFDTELQKAPKDGIGSGVSNLFYVDLGASTDQKVIDLRKLVPFTTLGLLADERDIKGITGFKKLASYLANEHSITTHLVPVGGSAAEAVTRVPKGVRAVLVGPLWQLPKEELVILGKKLIERQIAGFSTSNYEYVEDGLFATTTPEKTLEQLARQVAISIQEILLGEDPAGLPVAFSKAPKLTINMATARAIKVYPSLDYMTGARLINEERTDIDRRVTLPEVVAEALAANLDLAVAEREVLAGSYAVGEAKSALLTQVFVGAGGRVIDDDRAALSRGTTPEKTWSGGLSATQQIYSESSWAGYTVEKYNQGGRIFTRDSVKLDIIFDASTAYLNVLRRKTIEQLQKDNMQLTQANLDRAQIRLSTGIAGPDELYRWQTQFANDRQVVLRAESDTLDAMQGLNRILNRPLQEEFIAQETDLSDPLLIGGDRLFYELIHNPLYFLGFNSFAVQAGVDESPELKVLNSAISAQERLILKAKRDYWVPTFSVEADLDYLFSSSGEGQRDKDLTGLDDTDWQVGVFARLPIIEGGRKNATLGRNQEQLIQLKTQYKATEERISQRVLQSLNNTRASYPSINLSRDALDSAKRNLRLVTDSYVQGIKSIIDLLDAQNQALNAELDAANAVYNFLIDLMAVERSIGNFITFMPSEERKQWIEQVRDYLQEEK
ncbi:MAG: TolC family protein [Deltaproteobacteria bacterium]|nr:TolC family protein [Deltaproteobacteria bacterium]